MIPLLIVILEVVFYFVCPQVLFVMSEFVLVMWGFHC